jgi:hypothetical protein
MTGTTGPSKGVLMPPAQGTAPRRAPEAGAFLAQGLLAPQSRPLPHLVWVTFLLNS